MRKIAGLPLGLRASCSSSPRTSESTAALEIHGDSLGPFFNRWYVFYDDLRRPMTADLIGQRCVVGRGDRRTLVKQVQRGSDLGLYNLHSGTEKPIADVKIEWAARSTRVAPPDELRQKG